MIIRYNDASIRSGDDIQIRNYITRNISTSLSLAVSTLDGIHPETMSTTSDRAYFILEGEGKVEVGGEVSVVRAGDAVYIPKNTVHSIQGKVKYVLVNAPPFDPASEVTR